MLRLALTREKSAVALYTDMLTHASGGMMQQLLTQMHDDEMRHVRAIEKKLNDLLDGRL